MGEVLVWGVGFAGSELLRHQDLVEMCVFSRVKRHRWQTNVGGGEKYFGSCDKLVEDGSCGLLQ